MEKISDYSNIPRNVITDGIKAEIYRNNKIVFDGDIEIIKYSCEIICLKNKEFIITLCGENLEITYVSNEGIVIKGKLLKIEYMEV